MRVKAAEKRPLVVVEGVDGQGQAVHLCTPPKTSRQKENNVLSQYDEISGNLQLDDVIIGTWG